MPTRYPSYRLMVLSPKGQCYEYLRGSLAYLVRLGAQRRANHGRAWIEMTTEPATLPKSYGPRWSTWPRPENRRRR